MDVLVLALMLILTSIPLAVTKMRISRVIFCLVILIAGIMIFTNGITLTTLTSTPANYTLLYGMNSDPPGDTTLTYVIFLIMTLGSMMSIYGLLTEEKVD